MCGGWITKSLSFGIKGMLDVPLDTTGSKIPVK